MLRQAALALVAGLLGPMSVATPTPASAVVTSSRAPVGVGGLKIMNYYPAQAGWTDMWSNYSHATTMADFAAIRSLGANTVRIIVQPSAVGYPAVLPSRRAELDDMINLAARDGMGVQLTLFDMWDAYSDINGSERWVQSLLSGEQRNPSIVLVELKNEMALTPLSTAWVRVLMPYMRSVLPGVPRTISEPGTGGAGAIQSLLSDVPSSDIDAVDVHYYGDPALAAGELEQVKSMAGSKPVFIGETGVSTYATAAGEEEQVRFYEVMGRTARYLGLPPPAPWMLNDVTQAGGETLTPYQANFGLRRPDGSWKPAASVVRQLFEGGSPENWDGDMAHEAGDLPPVLGAWTEFDPSAGVPTVTPGLSYDGGQSICFAHTGGSSAKLPSVEQSFPVLTKNEKFTVSAWIQRKSGTGNERISIAGFNAEHQYVGEADSGAANGSGSWQELSVTGTVPPGISSVQIHLKTGYETGTACWSDVTIADSAP